MSNLIITVISIALVAVAALMAVWYGGDVYMGARYKAAANTVLSQTQQIVAAYTQYRLDGNMPSSQIVISGADVLAANGYLGGVEVTPPVDFSSPGLNRYRIRGIIYYTGSLTTFTSSEIWLSNVSYAVCQQINLIMTGSTELGRTNNNDSAAGSWTALTDSNGLTKLDRFLKWRADCYYADTTPTNGQYDSGEMVYFHRLVER